MLWVIERKEKSSKSNKWELIDKDHIHFTRKEARRFLGFNLKKKSSAFRRGSQL